MSSYMPTLGKWLRKEVFIDKVQLSGKFTEKDIRKVSMEMFCQEEACYATFLSMVCISSKNPQALGLFFGDLLCSCHEIKGQLLR